MNDLIYRFFASEEECLAYLKGRWRGDGLVALPDVPADRKMRLRMQARANGALELRLNTTRRLVDRWLNRSRSQVLPVRDVDHTMCGFDSPESMQPDYATWRANGWRLIIQAMSAKHLHLALENSEGIYYSGELHRGR